jgi:hypothetical protein
VRRHFRDGVLWLEVGQEPDIPALQAIIGDHFNDDPTAYNAQNGTFRLSRLLADKQALIVLDDVWDHRLVAHFAVHDRRHALWCTTARAAC